MGAGHLILLVHIILILSVVECRKKTGSDDKTPLMLKLSSQNGIVNIDNSNFKSLVKSNKKPYSVLLLLTVSHPKRKCSHCSEAAEEFAVAASSWRFSDEFSPKVFFAMVDYDYDGMNVFQALQINTAPVVLLFEAGTNKHQIMFFEKFGFSADGYAKFLYKTTNMKVQIKRPINYAFVGLLASAAIVFSLLVYKGFITWSLFLSIPWNWFVLFFIFLMTSGHMWNQIRGAQFMQYRDKEMVFIETWGDGQFIVETYIIFCLNAAIAIGIIVLCEVSGNKLPPKKKKILALIGILVLTFFFYLLLSVFKKKYEGYPYSFFFL